MSSLAFRIAQNSPDEANLLLVKNGYPASRNTAELEFYIDDFLLSDPDNAGHELMQIHPDKEFFEDFGNNIATKSNCSSCGGNHSNCSGNSSFSGGHSNCSGSHSNCSGCGGKCKEKKSNADGEGQTSLPVPINVQSMISSNMIFAMVAVVTLGIFGMVISKK